MDLDMVSQDLYATVLADELRFFTVQAYTDAIHAMWALTIRKNRYVLLAPESMPPVALLRRAQWRVVMFRRHLVAALDEKVLACAGLAAEGDLFHRWEPASVLKGPDRKSGVVEHMPSEGMPGVVYGGSEIVAAPMELELIPRDARGYTHCREDHHHHLGHETEENCARLHPRAEITYIPMRRLPSGFPVAFLTSRAAPPARLHLSGVGLTPIPEIVL